ncbi:ABC transporter permease [Actinosynnema pretiosum subsp. pretiosum]|uniref:Binding-protein-dependent transport systems inner membrane component n=2 Tax=Actinosynnema TaxID=40566 RepID=C6WIT3_ACTMD|nr:ABC transporter permease [Actinosynnema mirum]ACU38173.1 binding-protein-dependent transport systems inner membrane component [Actinosynnema mirum DSM 43827]AXX31678.1 putative ABC transporter (permease protein) [Actinosynnema pretiosum subsp. pretiosum]QUF04306.1 ABC transporter permease [Actinosynnema pretiosum subsp. pretiosum]
MSGGYGRYAAGRVAQAAVVVLLAYAFTFVVISVLPGDPVTSTLRDPQNGFTEEEIAAIVAYYGLDRPVHEQLWESLTRFLVGDFGVSLRSGLPVADLVGEVLWSTVVLALSALVVALVLAFAVAAGVRCLPRGQGVLRAFPSLFLSVPNFVIGLLLINVFAFQLGLFRVIDSEGPTATLFAAIALGIPVSAQVAEVLIANLDHESDQEYAAVARSRGLGRTALLLRHLLKPSSLPVVTVVALTVGELLGGAVITEKIFGRTGVGSLVERSVTTQDLPVLQAVVALAAVVFVVVNLVADLVHPLLDPRVRVGAAAARERAGVAR